MTPSGIGSTSFDHHTNLRRILALGDGGDIAVEAFTEIADGTGKPPFGQRGLESRVAEQALFANRSALPEAPSRRPGSLDREAACSSGKLELALSGGIADQVDVSRHSGIFEVGAQRVRPATNQAHPDLVQVPQCLLRGVPPAGSSAGRKPQCGQMGSLSSPDAQAGNRSSAQTACSRNPGAAASASYRRRRFSGAERGANPWRGWPCVYRLGAQASTLMRRQIGILILRLQIAQRLGESLLKSDSERCSGWRSWP